MCSVRVLELRILKLAERWRKEHCSAPRGRRGDAAAAAGRSAGAVSGAGAGGLGGWGLGSELMKELRGGQAWAPGCKIWAKV